MSTHSHQEESIFSNWNPHFTPPWLSERLSSYLPSAFSGAIIDPACGAGNLLAAATLRTRAAKRPSREIEFVGADISARAVRDCERVLTRLLPKGNFSIERANFLKDAPISKFGNTMVVMNPPFCGYGSLSKPVRKQISKMEMNGRVNLGYAFVQRAINHYRPEKLVSLLPSNWIHTRNSIFRKDLDDLVGRWEWEDVGNDAFEGISVDLGILLWRPKRRRAAAVEIETAKPKSRDKLDVRQGVATGRDAIFFEIGGKGLPFGKRALAVRGRDVGNGTGTEIWVPPRNLTSPQRKTFRALPRRILDSLRTRSCVTGKNRNTFQYHETPPDWFFGSPKLLLPEIVTKKVRVELDIKGKKLPLHSAIAIKVASIKAGRELKRYIKTKRIQKLLLSNGPRLAGGSVRLQVGPIWDVLLKWERSQKAAKKKKPRR